MILVLRALGVGDLATVVPALRGLRAAFPDRTLALAAPGWLAPLVELVGGVDRLVPLDGLDPAGPGAPAVSGSGHRWPGPAPCLAVNLHGRGPQSHRLLRSAGPGRLLAFRCPEAEHSDGPRWSPEEHEVTRWCRLLDWYGVRTDPADLRLHRPAPDRVPVAVTIVHPGGKGTRRRWAASRFARVARDLCRRGHRVVVTGSAAERDLAEQVAGAAGLPAAAVLAGHLDLVELAALVAHARLLISTDTGVAHLATGYGTPSVVLFGPMRPDRWGPPMDRPWHRALWSPQTTIADRVAGTDGPDRVAGTKTVDQVMGTDVPDRVAGVGRAGWAPMVEVDGEWLHPALAEIAVEQVLAAAAEVTAVAEAGTTAVTPGAVTGATGRDRNAVAAQ